MALNSSNSNNNKNTQWKSNNTNYVNTFFDNFLTNKKIDNTFLDKTFEEENIHVDVKNELDDELIKQLKTDNLFNRPENEKIKLESKDLIYFKNKLIKDYIILTNKRKTLKKVIFSDYDLDTKNEKKILIEIKDIPDSKLQTYIWSNKLRNEFVTKTLWDWINRKDIFTSIVPFDNFYKKLDTLPKADKDLLIATFTEIQNWKLTDSGLKELIRTKFLSTEQKKEILVNLIPTITLDEILSVGLLDHPKTESLKSKILDRYIDELWWDLSIDKIDLMSKIKNEDIIVEIDKFLENEDNLIKISECIWFLKTEKEFIKYTEEAIAFKNKEWVQTFEKLKDKLKKDNVEWSEKLEKWSVIKFNFESGEKKHEDYYTISSIDDNISSLEIIHIWNKNGDKVKIYKANDSKTTKKYHEFIELLKWNKSKKSTFKIFSSDEFEKEIKDTNKFEIETKNLDLLNTDSNKQDDLDKISDFKNDKDKQEKVKNEIIENYENVKSEIDKELSELNSNKNSIIEQHKDEKISDIEKKTKLETIEAKISQLNEKKKSFDDYIDVLNGNIDDIFEELVAQKNFNELLIKINDIDNEWTKIWLWKWVLFETKHGVYEITWLDIEKGAIEILGTNWKEGPVDYEIFFQAFKEQKAKRIQKTNSFEEIIDNNTDNWTEFWKKIDFDIKNWELIQKNVEFNWENNDKVIDFFITEKGEVFKIVSIWSNEVEVIFWWYSEWKKDKDTWNQKNTLKLEKDTHTLSFTELNKIINDNEFKPNWKIGKDYTTKNTDEYENPNIKWSFWTRFMNRLSITEVFMSWKMIIDWVEDYLKRWNEVKSAELAMRLSSIIPWEFSEDFMAQTEQKQEEAMEKELTALWKISSRDAFLRVEKWILNKDTPEYKKEAWLMLAAKYWMLYPKNIAKYEWTFLWYEVLWGKIWDTKYEEAKEKARKSWLPFDEKELLIDLLWSQCLWFSKPKRRSKYYKAFKWKIAGWFWEENDTWYKDAQDKRSIGDINDWWMAEVTTWVIPNALWWAKKAVEKWGSLKEMNVIYFSLMHSGWLYNAPWKVLEELKDHWTRDWNSMIMAGFASTLTWQKLFNKTVRDISIDIHNAEPSKYPWIKSEALQLYKDSESRSLSYVKRTEASAKFWDKYWDVLSRTLYMADYKNKTDDQYLKTDKIISMWGKDKYRGYMEHIKGFTNLPTAFAKWYMEDDVWVSGVTWIDNFEIVSKLYKTDTGWAFRSDNQKMIDFTWSTIWPDIKSTKDRIQSDPDNREKYKDYLNKKLREVAAWLISNIWIKNIHYIDNVDPAWLDLLSIWLRLSDLKEFRVKDIVDTNVWDEIFEKAVNNVISWNSVSFSKLPESQLFDPLGDTKNTTSNDVDNIVGNDYDDYWK